MSFATWYLPEINGGFMIALIAVIHVFVSQFAVGGGFFLAVVQRKALQEQSPELLQWVYNHSKFFLLITMVFGSLTGVGIWLIISLVSPTGTYLLINNFVFGWATEWTFFLGEIVALLLYVLTFPKLLEGKMSARNHLILGWLYALFAFLSLFIINGIITFMATPGHWLETQSFWDGFFNPTFWPSLAFRTSLSLMLAGSFGLITALFIKNDNVRHLAIQICARWICLPVLCLLAATFWYYHALPEPLVESIGRGTADIRIFIRSFIDTIPVLLLVGIVLFMRLPKKIYPVFVVLILMLAFIVNGTFEWVRETGRRPWLVRGYMYSNGLTVEKGEHLNKLGNLAASPWVQLMVAHALAEENGNALGIVHPAGVRHPSPHLKETGDNNFVLALPTAPGQKIEDICLSMPAVAQLPIPVQQLYGKAIFMEQCAVCHGQRGPRINIAERVSDRRVEGIVAQLMAQEQISTYMPPFFGTPEDAHAVASWLVFMSNAKQVVEVAPRQR